MGGGQRMGGDTAGGWKAQQEAAVWSAEIHVDGGSQGFKMRQEDPLNSKAFFESHFLY